MGISVPAAEAQGVSAPGHLDVLSEVFAVYADRLTRFVYYRLERADWHLAEDLTSEVFVRLVRWYSDRPIDDRIWGLLAQMGRQVIDQHFRLARSGEVPTGFTDSQLPVSPAAEEVAVVRMEARRELADLPAPSSAAARRQVEALTELAVAA